MSASSTYEANTARLGKQQLRRNEAKGLRLESVSGLTTMERKLQKLNCFLLLNKSIMVVTIRGINTSVDQIDFSYFSNGLEPG